MTATRMQASRRHVLEHIVADKATYHRAFRKDAYRTFTIPKKDGGLRQIDAPVTAHKAAQREALACLTAAGVLEATDGDHGFVTGRGIHTALKAIEPPRAIIQGDLEKAFHQITRQDVEAWARAEGLGYTGSKWLAAATCRPVPGLKGHRLVMGSPLAPALLIAITRGIRQEVARLARVYRGTAVWYADNVIVECPRQFAGRCRKALAKLFSQQRWKLKEDLAECPRVLGWTFAGVSSHPARLRRPGWSTSKSRRRAARGKLKRLDIQARNQADAGATGNHPAAVAAGVRAYLRGPALGRACSPRYARATV